MHCLAIFVFMNYKIIASGVIKQFHFIITKTYSLKADIASLRKQQSVSKTKQKHVSRVF